MNIRLSQSWLIIVFWSFSLAVFGLYLFIQIATTGDRLLFLASQDNCLSAGGPKQNNPAIESAIMLDLTKLEYMSEHPPYTPSIQNYIDERYQNDKPFKKIQITIGKGSESLYCEYLIFAESAELKKISTAKKIYTGVNTILFNTENMTTPPIKTAIDRNDYGILDKINLLVSYR